LFMLPTVRRINISALMFETSRPKSGPSKSLFRHTSKFGSSLFLCCLWGKSPVQCFS
jgi:hypothetical protein